MPRRLLGDVLEEEGKLGPVERLEAVVRAWQYCVAVGWWRTWWGLRGDGDSRGADRIGTVGGFAGLDNGTVWRFGGLTTVPLRVWRGLTTVPMGIWFGIGLN